MHWNSTMWKGCGFSRSCSTQMQESYCSKGRPPFKYTGWILFFCGWSSNKVLPGATTGRQREESEHREVFISFIVIPWENKNEIYFIAEVWQISFFKLQNVFHLKIFNSERLWFRGEILENVFAPCLKITGQEDDASFMALSQKRGALCLKQRWCGLSWTDHCTGSEESDCAPGPSSTMWPWQSHFLSLYLGFPICKRGPLGSDYL